MKIAKIEEHLSESEIDDLLKEHKIHITFTEEFF